MKSVIVTVYNLLCDSPPLFFFFYFWLVVETGSFVLENPTFWDSTFDCHLRRPSVEPLTHLTSPSSAPKTAIGFAGLTRPQFHLFR